MKIAIGCDHAGYAYKAAIKNVLTDLKVDIIDEGTDSSDSVDYPDFAHPVSKLVDQNKVDYGILICGSGNGVAMTANKYQNVRAALCWNTEITSLAKQHNNANVITIPARFVSEWQSQEIVKTFIQTDFEGGRHERRVNKISC